MRVEAEAGGPIDTERDLRALRKCPELKTTLSQGLYIIILRFDESPFVIFIELD